MEEHESIQLRSEEVQEILGTPPIWLVRWGSTVLFGTILLLFLVSWLVKYPDIIPAKIAIFTTKPPMQVVARSDGNLQKLLVTENQTVKMNDVVGVMQNSANSEHVMKIEKAIQALQQQENLLGFTPDKTLVMGELQSDYSTFLQAFEDYRFTIKTDFGTQNIEQLLAQIKNIQRDIEVTKGKRGTAIEKKKIAENELVKQKKLYSDGLNTGQDIENARSVILEIEERSKELESVLIQKDIEIGSIRNRILQIQQGTSEGNNTKLVKLKETINNLRSAIDRWKQTFLLLAPLDGRVSFYSKIENEGQFIKAGEVVMAILPEQTTTKNKIVGRMEMPIIGSGKVKIGQKVVIKLAGYPYQEFGTLNGKVQQKSQLPVNNAYIIEVALPDTLVTSYKKTIAFEQQLQGEAEIITEDRRFIERIFDKILSLFRKY
jgi:multidrug resistance efflux pump